MSRFDDERLQILARVSAGELTPQQGSLEIAMLKVQSEGAISAPESPAGPQARGRNPGLPSRLRVGLLLLIPVVMMTGVASVGLAVLMALPAYLVMTLWNWVLVPAVPGLAVLGFWQTLGTLVLVSLFTTALRWGQRVRVFMSGRPGFREQ